jgi:hypothetical protein
VIGLHKTPADNKEGSSIMESNETLDGILAQNPYLAELESEKEERRGVRNNYELERISSKRIGRDSLSYSKRIRKLEVQSANWEYKQILKYHRLTPIRVPSDVMKDVEPILQEAYQYAPDGASIKIRVHNLHKPFQRPKIRIEILGVLDRKETVRARFEYSMDENFSHSVFDKPQVFTYTSGHFSKSVTPFTIMKLPQLSYGTGERYSGRIGGEIVNVLRDEGYYLFVPFIIDDK